MNWGLNRPNRPAFPTLGELLLGQIPVSRPKLCYFDHFKSVFRKCNIPEADLEELAADRDLRSSTCINGLKTFKASSEQVSSDRCARRHTAAVATPAGPVCPHCDRICASDFVLHCHIRIHLYDHTTDVTTSLEKSTDYHKQASEHSETVTIR